MLRPLRPLSFAIMNVKWAMLDAGLEFVGLLEARLLAYSIVDKGPLEIFAVERVLRL